MFERISGTTLLRDSAPRLPGEPQSSSRPEQGRDVTSQPPDLDLEAILAAAVQRLAKLGKLEAAVALASSSITKVRGFNEWTSVEVFIASPGDAYDVLTQDDLYLHESDVNDFGDPYTLWGTSRLATVFTQVLPARMSCRDVEVKIAARPVDPNWRDAFRGPLGRDLATPTATSSETEATGVRARNAGRPGWTREPFWTHYRDAVARTDPPPTNASIAAHFEMLDGVMGIEPDSLRKLVRRFDLPPT